MPEGTVATAPIESKGLGGLFEGGVPAKGLFAPAASNRTGPPQNIPGQKERMCEVHTGNTGGQIWIPEGGIIATRWDPKGGKADGPSAQWYYQYAKPGGASWWK